MGKKIEENKKRRINRAKAVQKEGRRAKIYRKWRKNQRKIAENEGNKQKKKKIVDKRVKNEGK